jgi:hypothetical protein
MPAHEIYMLHIYSSRAIGGRQWVARLEHLPSGEQVRFTDPQALLDYLHTLIWGGDHAAPLHTDDPRITTD